MSQSSPKKSSLTVILLFTSLFLSGCGTTVKTLQVGVPDSYKGKLVKLDIKRKPPLPLVELEVLEIDGKVVQNPASVEFYPGEYVIKSQCKALRGIFTTEKTYYFKHGYQFALEGFEDEESGKCRARLMQYKTFVL